MTAVTERTSEADPTVESGAVAAGRPPIVAIDRPRRISRWTFDDKMTIVGALLGSFALDWVCYNHLLPFSGKVGFFLVWFACFLGGYALLTALTQPRVVVADRVISALIVAGPLIVACAALSMVGFTFFKGFSALTKPNFYTHDMSGVQPLAPLTRGGILHALVGTLIEVSIALAIVVPLGLATAVYLTEVGGRAATVVKTVVEAMTALPSIVAGLFIYTVLLVDLHFPSSGFAAAMALSVMGLPIMARAADVVLRVVPNGLREASYALGATRWQTVRRVVLPTARPGLATALILGIARMVGETSPVLLTSGASTFFNDNPFHNPMNSLPLFVFEAVRSGQPIYAERGFGAAAVLLTVVMILFVIARVASRPRKVNR